MRRSFNKIIALMGMLAAVGATSTAAMRDKKLAKGENISFSGFAENNFGSLSHKRVKGKWRVKR